MTGDRGTDPNSFDSNWPTPYAHVNVVLRELLPRIRAALGENFVGLYLFGSLVTGDFDPSRSDVDVLVVTNAEVDTEQFAALQAIHQHLAASDSAWATEVEAYYLTWAALRRDEPSFGDHLKVNRGGGVLEPLHRDAGWLVQGHILREYGVPLAGPDPKTLVEPVRPNDLRQATAKGTTEWLESLLGNADELRRPGFHVYVVLTLCRVLYTLANDAVASKQVAGRWARTTLDARWTGLVERALAWRKDLPERPGQTTDGDVAKTLELIRYTLARCR
jgi:predicted nucleotidyltransferase